MSIPPDQKWTSAEIKDDYERGFVDGMQEQMKRSVDKAVNRLVKREWVGLTEDQFLEASRLAEDGNYMVAFQRIQQWLKEKNV